MAWTGLCFIPMESSRERPRRDPPDLLNPPPMAGTPHRSATRPRCPSSLCLPPQHSSFWGPHPIPGNTSALQSPRLWFTPLPKQKPLPHLPTPPKARSCPGAVVPGHPHAYAQQAPPSRAQLLLELLRGSSLTLLVLVLTLNAIATSADFEC